MTLASGKKNDGVTIKGSATGLLIRLRDENELYPFDSLLVDLGEKLRQSGKFFQNGKTSIDLGKRELSSTEIEQLQSLLSRHSIQLERVISGAQATRSAARQVGVEYNLPSKENTRPASPAENPSMPFDNAEAFFARRTLRSGQEIRHHGDVCLVGDVNPGAKIVAGGSIIIWGVARGVLEAGALDSLEGEQATVGALHLLPSMLKIGQVVARPPEGKTRYNGPEIAQVKNGVIVVEAWSIRKA